MLHQCLMPTALFQMLLLFLILLITAFFLSNKIISFLFDTLEVQELQSQRAS